MLWCSENIRHQQQKHSGASSSTFWEGSYPLETKGDGATWPRAYRHSWIMYLEASSHSSSLLLNRNHIKLSYISQGLALKYMDYLSCYTFKRTCELYQWKKKSAHIFYLIFISQCLSTFQTLAPGILLNLFLGQKIIFTLYPPKIILSLLFTKQKYILISA